MMDGILRGETEETLSLRSEFVFYASSDESENAFGGSRSYFKHIQVRNRIGAERGNGGVHPSGVMAMTNIMQFQVYTSEGEMIKCFLNFIFAKLTGI